MQAQAHEGDALRKDVRDIAGGRFLEGAELGVAAVTMGTTGSREALAPQAAGPERAASSPADALELLKEGNARFAEGRRSNETSQSARRLELANGQSPFAVVLGCSDSRVPLDTVFDQLPGQLFGIRVAGNFVNDDGLGSIEYGVAILRTPLIVVLGHSACGAVGAAIEYVRKGTTQPEHIMGLVKAVEPAARATQGKPGDWVDNAVAANVRHNAAAISARSSIVRQAVKSTSAEIVGGVYDLHSGKVRWL